MFRDYISSIEELIEEARNGRMFILVDAEDRENEGDLVIPAQMCTPQAINFMAKYGRGLICLALTQERADELQIPMMTPVNGTPNQTAFTVSIEAREGISTGISAHDRARTISVAIDPTKGPRRYRDARAMSFRWSRATAARWCGPAIPKRRSIFARLAGLYPAGVICEIMNDDGTMARLPESRAIRAIARPQDRHHRRSHRLPPQIRSFRHAPVGDTLFHSHNGGEWKMIVYVNTLEYAEHIALVKGDISTPEPVLVRMHAINMFSDMLGRCA